MLGSVMDAEDVVQEAFLRWQQRQVTEAAVESPKAYLSTVVTRLCIDQLRSAQARREEYVGPWLPEPLVAEPEEVVGTVDLADSLSLAFLVLLESLSPVERAVFLLREAFDYPYEEIARIVGKSEDNCRQLLARARRHVDAGRPRFEATRAQLDALAERFFAACAEGDLAALEELLAADAAFYGDGGGKATAVPRPLFGRDRVMHFMRALFVQGERRGGQIRPVHVNDGPGALMLDPDGALVGVLSLQIGDDRIEAVRSVVNPDKLRHLGLPLSDMNLVSSRKGASS
jgi:RNA polymerase sigma-70 factor (ECF subfamily)